MVNAESIIGFAVCISLYDVIVHTETSEEHVNHLKLFERLRKVSLKLKPEKCKLVCDEVEYLGYLITSVVLKPNEQNLAVVREFHEPTTLKHLWQFLGLTS